MIRALISRFRGLWRSLPLPAQIVQGLALVLFFWGAACGGGTDLGPPAPKGKGDELLYRAIVERVRQGENYYRVTGEELHAREYATVPAFNWRLPTLAVLIAWAPSDKVAERTLFGLGTITAVLWCFYLIRTKHDLLCLLAVPLFLSMLPSWAGWGIHFHELWAGELLSMSLALRLLGFVAPSVLAGAAALSIRELALPFAVIMGLAAWREGHRRESLAWLAVVCLFGIALTGHLSIARSLTPPDALTNSWVAAGGWCHVLRTARTNMAMTLLPTPLLAAVVSLAWAGLWVWRSPGTHRVAIVVSTYLVAFGVVGRPDNFYWGMLIAPILILGFLGWAVALLRKADA